MRFKLASCTALVLINISIIVSAQSLTTLNIDVSKVKAKVSPTLYGIMTEEINHAYDGGLYAELVQNRLFKDDPDTPIHWSVFQQKEGTGTISLDKTQPYNDSLTVCLKLDATQASSSNRIGLANEGFWGMRVDPNTAYRASFYTKAAAGFIGAITVTIESNGGKILAKAKVAAIGGEWKKYSVTLKTTGNIIPSAGNRLVISVQRPGTLWFNLVSLFPPTYNNRPNGNRIDIMQKMVDLNPKFLRFPGGNYLEGNSLATYYNWKKTIHDLSVRPGHPGTWKYRSSDGIGLLEFLEWTEDLHIEPVLAVFAGYALNREKVTTGPEIKKYVDEALEEIEYVTGGTETKWGAQRAADGHPEPFKLTYVEIGNEDYLDRSGSYEHRFPFFFDAIREKYPQLKIMATRAVTSRVPDVLDAHFYRRPEDFYHMYNYFDSFNRDGPKIFIGEWASRPEDVKKRQMTPTLEEALGDAAWMTNMERNSDLVILAGYAPLFVNVNPGAMQWPINMIGYDAMTSYGSPSYYAQQMFYNNIGDVILGSSITGVPQVVFPELPPGRFFHYTSTTPVAPPDYQPQAASTTLSYMPALHYVVTKNTTTGMIYLKMVNILNTAQTIQINMEGAKEILPEGTALTLSGNPEDTNTITDPVKVIPVSTKFAGVKNSFDYTFKPSSVTILMIKTK